MKRFAALLFLFTLFAAGQAYAYTQYTVVNSNGQFALYSEQSRKKASLRCYVMKYNPCGYDCSGELCTRVFKPSGAVCPYQVQATNCIDTTSASGSRHERKCNLFCDGNSCPHPWLRYSQSSGFGSYRNTPHYINFPQGVEHIGAVCDINAQVMTEGI